MNFRVFSDRDEFDICSSFSSSNCMNLKKDTIFGYFMFQVSLQKIFSSVHSAHWEGNLLVAAFSIARGCYGTWTNENL